MLKYMEEILSAKQKYDEEYYKSRKENLLKKTFTKFSEKFTKELVSDLSKLKEEIYQNLQKNSTFFRKDVDILGAESQEIIKLSY